MFTPTFDSVLNEKNVPKAYVDLSDLSNPLWETFEIQVVPTLMFFKNGNAVFRRDGILGRGLSNKDMEEFVSQISGSRPATVT